MTKKQSAGLIPYRIHKGILQVFLVHPGGPFFAYKDNNVWSAAKGEFTEVDEPLHAAIREFAEETGVSIDGEFTELTPVILKSGKKVFAWMIEKDIDAEKVLSNNFEMKWPPKSGNLQSFPEVDKGEWFTIEVAKEKINERQVPLLDELEKKIKKANSIQA